MTNKITHAPQAVINELDGMSIGLIPSPRELLMVFSDISILDDWVYDGSGNYEEKQLALVNHFFGDDKLLPYREPEYLVLDHGSYLYLENGVLTMDNALNYEPSDYHGQGMTKDQASDFVHAFSGEVVEIPEPEDETRWYVETEYGNYVLTTGGHPVFQTNDCELNGVDGMTKKQAKGYTELFGGEAKEIK